MSFRIRPTTQFALTDSKEGGPRFDVAITKFSHGVNFSELTLSQEDGKRAFDHLSDLTHQHGYLQRLTSVPISMDPLQHPGVSDCQQEIDEFVNALRCHDRMSVEMTRTHANTYFGDGAFTSMGHGKR